MASHKTGSFTITIFSILQCALGILISAGGIYLMREDTVTTFSRAILGIGIVYLIIGVVGLISLRLRFVLTLYIVLVVLLFLWEVVLLVAYIFWDNKVHDLVNRLEGADGETVSKAADFLEDHSLIGKIVMGGLAAFTLVNVFATRAYILAPKPSEVLYTE